ncbi:MAG: glutaredoxin family protein [Betaproteobacteria bacterium]
MSRTIIAALIVLIPQLAAAQQQLYRYVDKDGRVVYSDSMPPADAKSVQQKKLGGNFIETSEAPYALQIAQQRNPVTLYTGSCGPLCDQARALLNKRGVPFLELDPGQPEDLKRLKAASGDAQVPVLVIGSAQMLKGFEEGRWQGALDQAGYPKTPAPRISTNRREAERPVSGAVKVTSKAELAAAEAVARGEGKTDAKGDVRPETPGEPKK